LLNGRIPLDYLVKDRISKEESKTTFLEFTKAEMSLVLSLKWHEITQKDLKTVEKICIPANKK
jgi:hypothetical protein